MEEIGKVPPLQQADIARHYEGIKVDWELSFVSADDKGNGNVLVLLAYPDHSFVAVRFGVKLSEYKELGIMNKGRIARVVGTIYHIDDIFITLRGAKLTY